MYAYIKGMLVEKANNYVVIDVQGIGYKIFMSDMSISKIGEKNKITKVYTHYYVREDQISLYGFLTNEELKMFELLLGISGIGAKSAISMLSSITPSAFAVAVISNDVKTITKIPGIGPKSAQRIILELKDKLKTETAIEKTEEIVMAVEESSSVSEAASALQILGYSKREVDTVLSKIDIKGLSVEEIIRKALAAFAK